MPSAKRSLRWGLIGGGRGSQIGDPHRIASRHDGLFTLAAGALDADADAGRAFAAELGIDPSRAYGTWQEMLRGESGKEPGERLDLVTVATPNSTHFEISRAFLEAGFNVFCEKPLTMTVAEAVELEKIETASGRICAVNFGYSGYPMAIQAREMIRHGELGDIRVVVSEFAHGFHAAGDDATNPRIRWRYDPAQAGVSSVVADIGTHAMHMAQFLTGRRLKSLSATFDHCVPGRQLEDDAMIVARMDGGAVARIWNSSVAVGQVHGFAVRVFGSKGGLHWRQEHPNQLHWTPIGESTRIVERNDSGLYPAANAASRLTIGHAEGMLAAFANLYRSLHDAITGSRGASGDYPGYPSVGDGADIVRAVHAAARSASLSGAWIDIATQAPVHKD